MAKDTTTAVTTPESYKMPQASVGACLWYPRPGGSPAPAMITFVGFRAVNVVVFPPDSRAGHPRDGCRHVSDPELANPNASEGGCWDYTDEQKRLAALEANLAFAGVK